MKRGLIALLIIALAPVVALAQPALIVDGGKLYFSDGSGTVATEIGPASLLSNVHYMPGSTPVPGPDDPVPEPPEDSQLREQVKGWATQVNKPIDATIMAAAYGLIGERIASGGIPATNNDVNRAQSEAFNKVFDNDIRSVDYETWESFYEKVLDVQGDLIVANPGGVPKDAWVKHFSDVQAGLTDSTEGNALPVWLQPIIDALIKLLIDMLLNLFNNAQAVIPPNSANVFVMRRQLEWSQPGDYLRNVALVN